MNRPKKSSGFLLDNNTYIKGNFFYSNAVGWIHSEPNFLYDRDNFFDYLIMYTISGKLHIEQYSKVYTLNPGQAILLNLFDKHKYYSDSKDPCEVLWIHFGGNECEKFISLINNNTILPIIISSNLNIYNNIKTSLYLAEKKEAGLALYMSLNIYELLIEILNYTSNIISKSNQLKAELKLVQSVDDYIKHNSDKPITLKMLSDNVKFSQYHFSRLFKQITGKSPMQYVTGIKIEKSKYLLLYTNNKINSIARELGFSDQSHFSRSFKMREGLSPSEFRNRYPFKDKEIEVSI